MNCPDGGTCHHGCMSAHASCFRVRWCGPLSGVFPGDEWPEALAADVAETWRLMARRDELKAVWEAKHAEADLAEIAWGSALLDVMAQESIVESIRRREQDA